MELPSEIIHRIQHFLNAAEAAQTTVLSKSWCSAWSTRPDLDFDHQSFSSPVDKFSEFANNTIKRYEDLHLNIQSFKLWMDPSWKHDDLGSLATELIQKAIKLGATDIQFGFPPSPYFFVQLPDELLRSQTLARLSLSGFIVDLSRRKNNDDGAAADLSSSSNLKSLNLSRVVVHGDFIRDLASRWPLIEELTLERSYLEDFFNIPECKDVMDTLLWRCEALASFRCLKQLVICERRSYSNDLRRISSPSLECIRIRLLNDSTWNAEFDVPNIRVFEYEGLLLSRFEFKETTSRCKGSWESDLRVTSPDHCDEIPCLWFSNLKTFVKMMSRSSSRVSLSMNAKIPHGESCVDGSCCRDGVATPAAAVENLSFEGEAVSLSFVENMILSCRPKFICVEEENVELLEEMRLQPWMTLVDEASKYKRKFVRFLLK